MRRRQSQSLGDVIKELLKIQHLDKKLNEKKLLDSWETVVGAPIAKYTTEKFLKNRVLHIKLSSSVLRNELMMSRQQLVDSLNTYVGDEVIIDIRFY